MVSAFFVIGPPRSGTTLMLDLLRLHPEVTAHGEDFHPFHHNLMLFRDRQDRRDHFHLTTGDVTADLRNRYASAVAAAVEKSGRGTFVLKISTLSQQIDYVRALLPEARFVQLVRDGRDAACSMEDLRQALEREQDHPRELGPAPDPFGLWCVEQGFPKILAATASWYYHVTRSFLDLRFSGTESFLRLRYEDLLADPSAAMQRALTFMGLSPSRRVERALAKVTNAPGASGGLGFSTSQAQSGPRVQRFVRDLPASVRIAAAPLLETPMRLLRYNPDPVPDATQLQEACAALGVDVALWSERIAVERSWFERQLTIFAPERLLREPDEPTSASRPVLVDGAVVGTTRRLVDGLFVEGVSFVAKQARRFTFADPDCRFPEVAAALTGEHTVREIEERFGLDPDGRAVLTRLHGLGFVGYA